MGAQVTTFWGDWVVDVRRATVGTTRWTRWGELVAREADDDSAPLKRGADDRMIVTVPTGATATVRRRRAVGEASFGQRVCEVDEGAIALERDATIVIRIGAIAVQIVPLEREEPRSRGLLEGALHGSLPHVAASALVHLALLSFVAWASPALGATYDDTIGVDQHAWMKQRLVSAAEQELAGGPAALAPVASDGGSGDRAAEDEGETGAPDAPERDRRAAIRWRGQSSRPRLPATRTGGEPTLDATGFGMAGLIGGGGAERDEPQATWGDPQAQGTALASAQGGMWGRAIGEAYGAGGLGLSGVGEGGGGRGLGIGLGRVGTIGRGAGSGRGAGLGRSHRARPPRVRCGHHVEDFDSYAAAAAAHDRAPEAEMVCLEWGVEEPDVCRHWELRASPGCATNVSGRLPPETVQAVLRQNAGRFRLCYQQGLREQPALEGQVVTRFVIQRDGSVARATATGALPDAGVKACIANALSTVTFPPPEGGVVNVTYPLMLTPLD